MINKTSEQLRTLMKLSAFFYFDRSRALLFVFGLLFAAVSAYAEPKIHALTKVIEGPQHWRRNGRRAREYLCR
jgi:hypothetical protein